MIDKLFTSLGCEVKACSCGCGFYRVYILQSQQKRFPYFTFSLRGSKIFPSSSVSAPSTIDINDPNSVEKIKKIIESIC